MNRARVGSPGRQAFLERRQRRFRRYKPGDAARLDDYLLELILIDTLAVADANRESIAERLIRRRIPPSVYPCVMDRYDELSQECEDDADVLAAWLPKAAGKDNRWKAKMVRWFVFVVAAGRRVSVDQLIEIARLASAIGASHQCRRLFWNKFDFDPYEHPAPQSTRPERVRRSLKETLNR